ncbi:MAG: P-II family nitrogen regulator [Acidobacteria bacterium]|nr:P-II family nitrogen regulator [Acidobacteriota bacterium]
MKEIKAIVQPFRLSKIVSALEQIPALPGITVFDVRGFGRQRGINAPNAVADESILYAKKVQLEIVVPDNLVEQVIRTICENAHTGNPGDGKIFVRSLDEAIRIRTGERGEQAI